MNDAVLNFFRVLLSSDELMVAGRDVLEVGSADVNGSVRSYIEGRRPKSYVGVDAAPGPSVDQVCDAGRLVDRFGAESFDVVVSTEMLEHVECWQRCCLEMAAVLRVGGTLVWSTRSHPFPNHGFPGDFWRYTVAAITEIMCLLDVRPVCVVPDVSMAGVMAMGVKAGSNVRLLEDSDVVGVSPAPLPYG